MRSSEVSDFLKRVQEFGAGPRLRAHAGNGIVHGHYADDLPLQAARELVDGWRKHATAVVVVKCPTAWKADLSVWGPAPPDIDAMRQVKARFDPKGLFNPGRFLDGL
jgi:FAD/FMN-containing dehydrogenase